MFPLLLPPLSVLRSWKGSGVLGRHRAPPPHWQGGMGGLGCAPVAWIGWEEDFFNGKCLKSQGDCVFLPSARLCLYLRKFYVGLKLSLALSVMSSGTGACRAASARSGGDGKGRTGAQHRWEGRGGEVALQWRRDGWPPARLWVLDAVPVPRAVSHTPGAVPAP